MNETPTVPPVPTPAPAPGLPVLGAAVLLGLCGDALLRSLPWGLNFFLCITLLTLVVWGLSRWLTATRGTVPGADEERTRLSGLLYLTPVYAAGWVWHDSPLLHALDLLAIFCLCALVTWRRQGGMIQRGSITGYTLAAIMFVVEMLFGFLVLICRNVPWRQMRKDRVISQVGSVLLGLVLTAPVVLVFGLLFSSADAAFEKLMVEIFNLETLFVHGCVTVICAWFAAGFLRSTLLGEAQQKPSLPASWRPQLGGIEIGMVLGALNLLFLVFVGMQFRYFFGGEAQLEITPGLLRSEYARRGFFELVAVAGLVIPLLLVCDWLIKPGRKGFFRLLAGLLILMVFIVMASAAQRMWIYQSEFGLTELRFYTSAFMGWLGVVLLWLGVTVLREQRDRFIFGALVSGLAAIVILHVVSPDRQIARVNLARADRGDVLDSPYLLRLSADVVPELARAWPKLSPDQREMTLDRFTRRWSADTDWRSWNISRARARRAVERLQPEPAQAR